MADLTTVQIYANNISNVSQVTSTTVLSQSSGTINLATLNLSNTAPADIARTASAGSSNVAARADHVHNAANLLMDGGNY
jgi:hypothetical protein